MTEPVEPALQETTGVRVTRTTAPFINMVMYVWTMEERNMEMLRKGERKGKVLFRVRC